MPLYSKVGNWFLTQKKVSKENINRKAWVMSISKNKHILNVTSQWVGNHERKWLMFLFEIKPPLTELPPAHSEGTFQFAKREELDGLNLPLTDREQIWPLFWQHRGGFFAAHCRCTKGEPNKWSLEQSNPIT